jgi:carbamoyltransferase
LPPGGGIRPEDLDHVVFYEKPYLKFERLLETYLSVAPAGFRSFRMAMPLWIHEKLRLPGQMGRASGAGTRSPSSSPSTTSRTRPAPSFPSPFEEAAILTLDGVGEWATATLGHGRGNRIALSHEMRFPHSLGLLYSAFTYFCGFRVNSGEYKLMGLAPFGEPRHAELIVDRLMDLREDGSFRLDLVVLRLLRRADHDLPEV